MVNDFLPFGIGTGANVIDQATYAGSSVVGTGFQSGLADSRYLNKAWRQSSVIAAAIAQRMVNVLGVNAYDDGNFATLLANLSTSMDTKSGGGARELLIQTGVNSTGFVLAPTVAGQILSFNGSVVQWSSGSGASFTGNGYAILSNGLILQWGDYVAAVNDTAYAVSLPFTFPNAHLQAFASVKHAGTVAGSWSGYAVPTDVSTITLTGDVDSGSATNIPLAYFSIGF